MYCYISGNLESDGILQKQKNNNKKNNVIEKCKFCFTSITADVSRILLTHNKTQYII